MSTRLEASIVVAVLVAAMFLAMWASSVDARIVMRHEDRNGWFVEPLLIQASRPS